MTLIKSISGIRGTIGGKPGEGLTPVDIVKFSAAFGTWIIRKNPALAKMVIGRDARISGPMVSSLVITTLRNLGINVIDLEMASTPTVEVAVTGERAGGGIIVTASHNPGQWNALKLLNKDGEFLSAADGEEVLALASAEDFEFTAAGAEGSLSVNDKWTGKHIEQIMRLDLVDSDLIRKAGLTVAVDCINSVGGIIVPELLKSLGVRKVIGINMNPDGKFSHNPEPLPENLSEISKTVKDEKADLGFVVDPDVDRLAVICEDGTMFGEEYTLVAVSDYVLSVTRGNTVSNMSSTRALKDITETHGCKYFNSPVGEVNVVEEMKRRNAVIGGEGNGGVIYPALHYGRDSLVGIALFLTHFSKRALKCSDLRRTYPDYVIAKKKMILADGTDFEALLKKIREEFKGWKADERDGLRIDNEDGWVQIRKSNTEPIIRIYSEGKTVQEADNQADRVIAIVKK